MRLCFGYCYPAAHGHGLSLLIHLLSFLPEEFQSFVGKLPTHYAVNTSVVEHLWRTDGSLLQRYRQLETSSNQLFAKARRTTNKLFSLSRRCRKKPKVILLRPRWDARQEQEGGIFMLWPVNPRCSPKLIIMRMIYAAGGERKHQSETALIRRHLRKSSRGMRWKVLTGAKLLLRSCQWKTNEIMFGHTRAFHRLQV